MGSLIASGERDLVQTQLQSTPPLATCRMRGHLPGQTDLSSHHAISTSLTSRIRPRIRSRSKPGTTGCNGGVATVGLQDCPHEPTVDNAELPLPDRNRIHGSPQDPKRSSYSIQSATLHWLGSLGYGKLHLQGCNSVALARCGRYLKRITTLTRTMRSLKVIDDRKIQRAASLRPQN
jgi:hypothetical protein